MCSADSIARGSITVHCQYPFWIAGSLQEPNQIQAGQGDVHCPRGTLLWPGIVKAQQQQLSILLLANIQLLNITKGFKSLVIPNKILLAVHLLWQEGNTVHWQCQACWRHA